MSAPACFRCGGHGYPNGSQCPECRGAGTLMHHASPPPARPLAVTVHETTEVPGWPPGTERVEGDHYACVYNAPCMHHEVVRGLDHERRNGWRFVGQADIDGVGDCLVFWRM